ncbi:MAG: IS5 family transposase [Parachlamydiaceae bacterium]|nr:MAG: IS5 family transposase [Parachlamydiaceae bacterium]
MQTEPTYRIRNWSEYNRTLIERGSISIWIEEKAAKNWFSSYHTCRAGRPTTYSDEAILMMLILREVYKRSLRNLQGFVQSLFRAMNLNIPVPSYSQISRRAKTLHKRVNRLTQGKKACHIIFDSTGLKVNGEGEWKVKVHGKSKRRTWRKFHIGIDAETQDILCCELTGNNKGDAEVVEQMLGKLPCKVKSARGDGAYDASRFRKKVHEKGGVCIVPPPRDAAYKVRQAGKKKEMMPSQQSMDLAETMKEGDFGRSAVVTMKRSLAEIAMFRIKRMLGGGLKARSMGTQKKRLFVNIW